MLVAKLHYTVLLCVLKQHIRQHMYQTMNILYIFSCENKNSIWIHNINYYCIITIIWFMLLFSEVLKIGKKLVFSVFYQCSFDMFLQCSFDRIYQCSFDRFYQCSFDRFCQCSFDRFYQCSWFSLYLMVSCISFFCKIFHSTRDCYKPC